MKTFKMPANDKLDRLRVLGFGSPVSIRSKEQTSTEVIFSPVNQVFPPSEDPYAADSNTLNHLCDLVTPWFCCDMFEVAPNVLGQRIKYLLRQTNQSYPEMFSKIKDPGDLCFPNIKKYYPRSTTYLEMIRPWKNPAPDIVFDIQAYDRQVVITGSAIPNLDSPYWPKDYVDFATRREFEIKSRKLIIASGKDLKIPENTSNETLGKLLLRIWAGRNELPFPPPPEYEDFVQRIMD